MKQLKTSLTLFMILSFVFGIAYPLAMTGISQLAFSKKANGSLIAANGRIVGSELIGQSFYGQRYFHGRPSASNYDATNSRGSNFGPTNRKFIEQVETLADQLRKENGLPTSASIPSDLVLASGSGLDPHISIESARLQAARIAAARGIDKSVVIKLVEQSGEKQYFGLFGYSYVNVLKLNLTMDAMKH